MNPTNLAAACIQTFGWTREVAENAATDLIAFYNEGVRTRPDDRTTEQTRSSSNIAIYMAWRLSKGMREYSDSPAYISLPPDEQDGPDNDEERQPTSSTSESPVEQFHLDFSTLIDGQFFELDVRRVLLKSELARVASVQFKIPPTQLLLLNQKGEKLEHMEEKVIAVQLPQPWAHWITNICLLVHQNLDQVYQQRIKTKVYSEFHLQDFLEAWIGVGARLTRRQGDVALLDLSETLRDSSIKSNSTILIQLPSTSHLLLLITLDTLQTTLVSVNVKSKEQTVGVDLKAIFEKRFQKSAGILSNLIFTVNGSALAASSLLLDIPHLSVVCVLERREDSGYVHKFKYLCYCY